MTSSMNDLEQTGGFGGASPTHAWAHGAHLDGGVLKYAIMHHISNMAQTPMRAHMCVTAA